MGTRHWAGSALALRLAVICGTDVSLIRCSISYSWITLDVIEATCGISLGIARVPQLCKVSVVFS